MSYFSILPLQPSFVLNVIFFYAILSLLLYFGGIYFLSGCVRDDILI